MILDAWSIVDWANRLHGLIQHFPGLQKSTPAVRLLMNELEKTRDFRDYMQHIENDLHADNTKPVWGALMWSQTLMDLSSEFESTFTVELGTESVTPPRPHSIHLVRPPLDLQISDLADTIANFGKRFNRSCEIHGWKDSDEITVLSVEL